MLVNGSIGNGTLPRLWGVADLRKGANGLSALGGAVEQGLLQSNGYKVYTSACSDRSILPHARRKFYEA